MFQASARRHHGVGRHPAQVRRPAARQATPTQRLPEPGMHVCLYQSIYTSVYLSLSLYLSIYIYLSLYIHIYIYMYTHMYIYTYICILIAARVAHRLSDRVGTSALCLQKCHRYRTCCRTHTHTIHVVQHNHGNSSYLKLRHFCDDPVCPDPVWKLSSSGFLQGG